MRRTVFCVAVATAALLASSTSFAAIDKCQKRIQGEGAKLQKFIYSAVQKCADAIRKEKALGALKQGTGCGSNQACLANAAAICEKLLADVYDAANLKPNKSKIELFRATLEKSSSTNECTDADLRILEGMGHQLSGNVTLATAPPTGSSCDFNGDGKADTDCRLTFLIDWLLYAIEDSVIRQLQAQTPDLFALLKEAIDATSSNPAKPQTDCSNSASPGYRPNLCRFGVQCFTASCNLSAASNATLQAPALSLNAPISLQGALPVQVCRPGLPVSPQQPGLQLGLGSEFHAVNGLNNALYLIGGGANSVRAPGPYPPPLNFFVTDVCVSVVGQQGWCDCGSPNLGVAKDATVCHDRVGDQDLSPPSGPTGQTTDECGVASSQWVPDSTFPASNSHAPSLTITPSSSSSSTAGDCVNLVTLQFTLLTDVSQRGADGIGCTPDDTASPLASFTVPLTTGMVTTKLMDAIKTAGTCTGGQNPPCLRDADCAQTNSGSCDPSTLDVQDVVTSVTGSTGTCAEYMSGNLSNLKFVSGAALADLQVQINPPPAPPSSLDGLLTVELDCQ